MPKTQELLYAVVGAGDLAAEKVRGVSRLADGKVTRKYYRDLVKRGKTLAGRVRNSGPTKQAFKQTKVARSQVKAAATSVGKAVRGNAQAAKSATEKIAD